jgi:hypothetical protein
VRNRLDTSLKLWLGAAFLSLCFSILLWFFVGKEYGLFVGLWVPSILALAAAIRSRPS